MTEEELEQLLVLDGKKLKKPLASVDELLSLIDRKNSLEKSASKTSTSDQSHLEETSNTKSKRKRGVVMETNAWAEKFKNKTCLHYDQLSIICGNTIATGSFSSTGLDINDGDAQYGIETQFPEEDVELSPSDDFDQQTPTENRRQRSVTPSSSRNRQRPRSHAESTQMMSASVENMATAVTNYLEAMKKMEQQKVNLIREIEQRKIDKLNEESLDGCLEALMDMPGLSEEILFAATELFENKEKRRTFLKLDPAKRVNWLYWVIGKGL